MQAPPREPGVGEVRGVDVQEGQEEQEGAGPVPVGGAGGAGSPRAVTSPRDIIAVRVTGSPTPNPKHGGRGQEVCGLGGGVKASTGSVGGVIMDGDVSR